MGVIVYETPDGENRVSTDLSYDAKRSAWKLDVSEGGVNGVDENFDELLIPEHRVYSVQLASVDRQSGTATF